MKSKLLLMAIASSVGLLFTATPTHAQLYYTDGHADIGIGYEDGELHPHWHGNTSGGSAWNLPQGEYDSDEVVAVIFNTRNSANGSANYLGVPTGTPVYVAGLINVQPWLGFGAEELNPLEWVGDITITLTGWTTPDGGEFALYTTNGAGTSTTDVYLSSYDPDTADAWGLGSNVFGIGVGGHDHYQFGFTAPGYYELTLEFSGEHATDGLVSGSGTFGFQVIPEPSIGILAGIGLAGLVVLRRFRRRG